MKSVWSDGTKQIVLPFEELLEKKAAGRTSEGEPAPAQRRHRLAWPVLLARVIRPCSGRAVALRPVFSDVRNDAPRSAPEGAKSGCATVRSDSSVLDTLSIMPLYPH